jgi:hypothetical protein
MPIPPTTSRESRLREALLDALHAQWRELGVPFGSRTWDQPLEVIDPEALIWCSLEFAGRDPRLIEGVHSWVADHRSSIVTQRLSTMIRHHAADPREQPRCIAMSTCLAATAATTRRHVGAAAASAGAIHLRARDILGNGLAAFLLVELLGHPRGVRCRQVAETTGASYRSIVEVAGRWQRSELVTLDRGFCTLLDPRPWHEVLRCTPGSIVTVPWNQIYTVLIDHLRELAHVATVGIADDDRLIIGAARQVRARVAALVPGLDPSSTPIVTSLLESISD